MPAGGLPMRPAETHFCSWMPTRNFFTTAPCPDSVLWLPLPVRLLRLPAAHRSHFNLSSHRYAIHAAAPCPVHIKEEMINWWGPILYEYYSGTEGNGQTAINTQQWLAHKGSVGQPILGSLRIVGDNGIYVVRGVWI